MFVFKNLIINSFIIIIITMDVFYIHSSVRNYFRKMRVPMGNRNADEEQTKVLKTF